MVAFASARGALEWCLLVQEAAMYLNWPDDSDRLVTDEEGQYCRKQYNERARCWLVLLATLDRQSTCETNRWLVDG